MSMTQTTQSSHGMSPLRHGNPILNSVVLLLAIATLLMPCRLSAQSTNGTVTGTVSDPQGNVVQGATVTLIDTQRGVTFTAQTNEAGTYRFSLPIGNYKAQVQKNGFDTLKKGAFDLELGQSDRVDFTLKVGSTSEIIEVRGEEAPLLKVESDQLDMVVDEKTTEDLPLATRNYVQMTLLVPGSTNPNPDSMTKAQNEQSAGRPEINGNNEQSNNFLLDGLENNQLSDNLVAYVPSIDAIQEFTIITQDPSAEYGNFEGGTITTAIKSGTNKFHGSAFEFFRNDIFNATPWYNGWENQISGQAGTYTKPSVRWNMFGATFGGPILKNKLFFFGDFQGQRFDIPASSASTTVLTNLERAGNFSDAVDGDGNPLQLYDPTTAVGQVNCPAGETSTATTRCTLLNNTLTHIDPAAAAIIAALPGPTGSGLSNNLTYTEFSKLNGDQGDIKIDYAFSAKDHIFARASKYYSTNPQNNSTTFLPENYTNSWGDSGIAGWTHQISQTLFNDFRFGVGYTKIGYGTTDSAAGDLATTAGINNANKNQGVHVAGLPNFVFSNDGTLQNWGSAGADALFADSSIQFDEAVTWIHNTHTIKAGFQFRRYRINTFYAGNDGENGQIYFTGVWTAPNGTSSTQGNGAADFMAGFPQGEDRGAPSGTWGQRANMLAGYIQDDWKVNSSLTLNLGLRYDNHTPLYEVQGRSVNFDLMTGQPIYQGRQQLTALNSLYGDYSPEVGNKAGYSSYNLGWDFQPRLGFAYSPAFLHSKGVVRGALGITSYMEGSGTNLRITENAPFVPGSSATFSSDPNAAPTQTLEQGFVGGQAPSLSNALERVWYPNIKPATDVMWNLAVQYQLTGHDTVQAAYVGQKVTHTLVPMMTAQFHVDAAGNLSPGDFLGEKANYGTNNLAIFQVPGLPDSDPNDQNAFAKGTASVGNESYNGLQVTYGHRFDKGLEIQLAETYSKCLADNIGYYGGSGQSAPQAWYWQDLYNQKSEWGNCYYDTKEILTGYAVYTLPFGQKQKFGSGANSVTNAVIGGWQIGALTTNHTGYALTAINSPNVLAYGSNSHANGATRANCTGPIHYHRAFNPLLGEEFFDNSTGLEVAGPSGLGNCANGSIRGPGLDTVDASLQKQFSVFEALHTEFRFEAVNVLNHPIFGAPDMTITDKTFGISGGSTSSLGERQLQFALKFTF